MCDGPEAVYEGDVHRYVANQETADDVGNGVSMSEPNDILEALIREADERAACSWAGLARRVNVLGAEEGLALRYDYTAVHRWVRLGQVPKPPVPGMIARALSEKLGRRVDAADFGMSDEQSLAARGLQYPASPDAAISTISEMGKADVKRRDLIHAPFVLAALAASSRDWLLATLDETTRDTGPQRIGMRQVAGIREMFALFQEMDVMRGGGHARLALVEYMNSYVMPLVRREHDPQVQRSLYEAAAEQAYLVGWMAYDDGEHGLAQRYLIQALRLSQESGNAVLGAHVLAGMSDQANLLGHAQEAVALARSGRRGITVEDSPACLADLYVLEARALARLGEDRAATQAVAQSEQIFEQVTPEHEQEWARFIDRAYVFGEIAHTFRDLGQSVEMARFANESLDAAHLQGRARREALSEAALALGKLQHGEVEAAAAKATKVVQLSATVNSSRCVETVRELQRKLTPYGEVSEVQRFNQHAQQLLGFAA
jgi:tetratricopeptide (TPR) repeat protein